MIVILNGRLKFSFSKIYGPVQPSGVQDTHDSNLLVHVELCVQMVVVFSRDAIKIPSVV